MKGIRLEHLSKTFGPTVALSSFDLDIERGEWVTLLGPSGCGKTTTLRIIAGFTPPTTGVVTIGERVVSDPARRVDVPIEHRRLGMVFQAYAVWPHLDVLENVAYPLRLRRIAAKEVEERTLRALDQVQLSGLAKRYPHELSGGQQQRVALARALVSEPDVLLLDEPLSALDARLRLELRALLAALHRDTGLTVVFVTHDQDEAITLSDRIVVMSSGEVQQIGTPREVYQRPVNEFVAGFIGSGSILPVRVRDGDIWLGDVNLGPHAGERPPKSILVRPEHVSIHDDGAIVCDVRQRWFKGDHELVHLTTPVGELTTRYAGRLDAERVRVDLEHYVQLTE
jgi:iron(III) transport system ATP-binding protein